MQFAGVVIRLCYLAVAALPSSHPRIDGFMGPRQIRPPTQHGLPKIHLNLSTVKMKKAKSLTETPKS